ncbi:ClpP/crotonase [Viridothelium virens]|uniref:ClpP/crotonase n=1 Tax=Viridothelium virens TaxID=1048519 RepID=A0A6A6HA77_VIRVR|nr:ClpP/crotonase [Viridothelium virens]
MRRPVRLPTQCLHRSTRAILSNRSGRHAYSTTNPSTIKVTNIPAPHSGSIRILTLNRPEARNAISRQLLTELRREVDSIHAEGDGLGPTRALILASEVDASFCAGADLKERRGMSQEETATFLFTLRSTLNLLASLPIPTLTALASLALGGGLELALTTHLRIFSHRAVVGLPETRLAIIPGAGGCFRLPSLIGLARARDLILTGRRVGGAEAYFMGLCDRLVEVGEGEVEKEGAGAGEGRRKVLEEAVRVAREICEGGPVATRAALGALRGSEGGRGEEAEEVWYERVVGTEDRNEALRAFAEKRKPMYKGR